MIKTILISDDLINYLKSRKLENQYQKSKEYVLDWNLKRVNFKLREPKKNWIYYFRINKQYRALAVLDNEILKIFDIDDHQK